MASKFVQKVEQLVAANPLVMFSKTTCGYCGRGECRRAHGARGREGGGAEPGPLRTPAQRTASWSPRSDGRTNRLTRGQL